MKSSKPHWGFKEPLVIVPLHCCKNLFPMLGDKAMGNPWITLCSFTCPMETEADARCLHAAEQGSWSACCPEQAAKLWQTSAIEVVGLDGDGRCTHISPMSGVRVLYYWNAKLFKSCSGTLTSTSVKTLSKEEPHTLPAQQATEPAQASSSLSTPYSWWLNSVLLHWNGLHSNIRQNFNMWALGFIEFEGLIMAKSSTYEKYFYIQIYMYFTTRFNLKFSACHLFWARAWKASFSFSHLSSSAGLLGRGGREWGLPLPGEGMRQAAKQRDTVNLPERAWFLLLSEPFMA